MKIITSFIFLLFSVAAFSQSKKVAVIMATMSTDDELKYEAFVRPYVESHLKKIPGIELTTLDGQLSASVKNKRKVVSGSFLDNTLIKTALAAGVDKLVLVYYEGGIIEKKVLDPGMESTSYGCEINIQIQIVNVSSGQIADSKLFFFSMGSQYKSSENYKTKEDAVKAALASQPFAAENHSAVLDVSAYLRSAL